MLQALHWSEEHDFVPRCHLKSAYTCSVFITEPLLMFVLHPAGLRASADPAAADGLHRESLQHAARHFLADGK